MTVRNTGKPAPKPKKRPRQDRAKFTVKAIYDSLVRIWRRDGPEAATTRAIAEEAGFAIGTLYEYFPNREAVLSGYIRSATEDIVEALMRANQETEGQPWKARLHTLIMLLTAAIDSEKVPYFDRHMMLFEAEIAEPHHQKRAFDDLANAWASALTSWPDVPVPITPEKAKDMAAIIWGTHRYMLLLETEGNKPTTDWRSALISACTGLILERS